MLQRVSEVHYLIQKSAGGKVKRVHVDTLKKFHEDPSTPRKKWICISENQSDEVALKCSVECSEKEHPRKEKPHLDLPATPDLPATDLLDANIDST